jgi:hypothetical protein
LFGAAREGMKILVHGPKERSAMLLKIETEIAEGIERIV